MVLVILIIDIFALSLWLKYLKHLDKFTTDKRNEHTLLGFVAIGGLSSVVLTLFMQTVWEWILFILTGLYPDTNPFVQHILIVGPVEELSKFLVFIMLAQITKTIKEPRDGILQAVSVALGFAIIENFLYAYRDGISVLVLRSTLSIIGHMTFSVIWGFAWAAYNYSKNSKYKSPDRYAIIPFWAFASIFHGLYNFFISIGYPQLSVMINLLTMLIFSLIYNYVKDNSPYREYKLSEYKKAIPEINKGLQKHPDSFVLNKRMGVFNIYAKHYTRAGKYLNKARMIKPKSSSARFYYGVTKYLNGETEIGLKHINKAVDALPVNMQKKMLNTIKTVVRKSDREGLLNSVNSSNGQPKVNRNIVRRGYKSRRYYASSRSQKSRTAAQQRITKMIAERENWGKTEKQGRSKKRTNIEAENRFTPY